MSVILAVLLRALSEWKFVGHPLWRMADGKIMFASNWPFTRRYERYQSTRRGLKAGGSLHLLLAIGLPTAARRPPDQRPTTVRRPTPCMEKETPPPPSQALPDSTRSTITHDYTQKTAIVEPAPIITRPTTPPPTTDSPPKKKSRISSPDRDNIEPPWDYNNFPIKDPD